MITVIGIYVIMRIICSDRSIVLTGLSLVAGQMHRLAAEIAQSVEPLGDKFRPAMCGVVRWLAEIHPDRLCCRACIRFIHGTGHIDRG